MNGAPALSLSLPVLGLRYAAFAAVATLVNLASQSALFAVYDGTGAVYAALALGTLTGLVVKYVLDKRWIFGDRTGGAAVHARKFSLYTLMGVFTTVIFWGTELAFHALWGDGWRYVGGALGLAVGYVVKYRLDRRFVFQRGA